MTRIHDNDERRVIDNPNFEPFVCDGCKKTFYRHVKRIIKVVTCGKRKCQQIHKDNLQKELYERKKAEKKNDETTERDR